MGVGFNRGFASFPTIHRATGIHLRKRRGQYLIVDDHLIEKIVDSARIRSTDTVIELGSGTGTLTSRLLPLASRVICVESDEAMANENLKRSSETGYSTMESIRGDALHVDFPRFDVCIANLPFSLSAPILVKLIKQRPLWRTCALIVQREFADALIADPGERNYSRLSLNMSMFFRTERVSRIHGASFYPVPPVESSLIRLIPRNPPPQFDFDEFNSLVKTCFIEKKTNLRRIFSRPSVVKSLEINYKNYCSFHRLPTSPIPFPQYLETAVYDSGLSHYCAKHLPAEALQHLLETLHYRGIYFTCMPEVPPDTPVPIHPHSTNLSPPLSQPLSPKREDEEELVIPVVS